MKRLAIESETREWIVTEKSFEFDDAINKLIKQDVAQKKVGKPTEKQWEMILSPCSATCVIAGAGSGKSTSLVLRLITLNKYLSIDLNHISVFTFTKASRADFIRKLQQKFKLWDVTLSEQEAKQIVQTFHAMVLKMAREAISSTINVFEYIDGNAPIKAEDVENLIEGGESTDTRASNKHRLFRLAYESTFSDPEGREALSNLLNISLEQERYDRDVDTDHRIKQVTESDEALTNALERGWKDRIAQDIWPLEGVTEGLHKISLSSRYQGNVWVNGYIESLNAYIVLGDKEAKLAGLKVNGII